ncbi:ImmA/IrrE family metallo-endopeptidase [Homoserinibacter sp. YIM 151385]|uniref:ImmA/IrrE family metallo-endopeptidase n=1 Tax=Homoserinibacter sp. YIM 151385 TaxID=2985506 RepID=UPI0022F0E68C|nr:ImmA/IrrE family metallo-endopeptidase [Homoserinibacter sp. YIM 151385]WBU37933.1 ImmA/IrrE family metallo-endopeptidase [Homoserinibacter sp. YIM 151385]
MTRAPYDPYRHAEVLGLRVETARMGHDGLWLPDEGLVLLRPGLLAIQERCILAHEIGHAVLGHRASTPRTEAAADRYAAERLVDRAALLDSMRATGDATRWSLELGVTRKVLGVYLERHGERLSRLGRDAPEGLASARRVA